MKRIYLALGIYTTIFLIGTLVLGLRLHETQDAGWRLWHIRAGLFVAIFVCFVHSLIFIHLLGTGLGIKRAIEEHGLPEGPRSDIHRFKMRAFPPAFGCMVLTIATAVAGEWVGGTPHLVLAIATLVANAITVPWVVKQLGENERVMRAVEAQLAAREVAPRP
ncbi:MAG TPA: hypothetical protein VFF73_10445 [Planctomycetota bacterium]|nr:hypothetical protein [Planctomycetota bacterium]